MSSAQSSVQQAASTMARHGAAVRAADPAGTLRLDQKLGNYVDAGLPENKGQWNTYLKSLAGLLALQSRARKALEEASDVIAVLNNDKGRHGRIGDVKGKDLWDSKYNFKTEIDFEELPVADREILKRAIKAKRGRSYKHYGKAASDKINAAGKIYRAKMAPKNKLTDEEKRAKRRARDAARRQRERDAKAAQLAAMTPEEREAYEQEEKAKKEARKQSQEQTKFKQFIAGLSPEQLQAMIAQRQAQLAAINN